MLVGPRPHCPKRPSTVTQTKRNAVTTITITITITITPLFSL